MYSWRVEQLRAVGLTQLLAETFADLVDWHEVATLVERGCAPESRAGDRALIAGHPLLLKHVQPAMAGLIDGSLSTLAPRPHPRPSHPQALGVLCGAGFLRSSCTDRAFRSASLSGASYCVSRPPSKNSSRVSGTAEPVLREPARGGDRLIIPEGRIESPRPFVLHQLSSQYRSRLGRLRAGLSSSPWHSPDSSQPLARTS